MTDYEFKQLCKAFDQDGSGTLNYVEFERMIMGLVDNKNIKSPRMHSRATGCNPTKAKKPLDSTKRFEPPGIDNMQTPKSVHNKIMPEVVLS